MPTKQIESIKSRENLLYVVNTDDLFPLVNNAGTSRISVTAQQIVDAATSFNGITLSNSVGPGYYLNGDGDYTIPPDTITTPGGSSQQVQYNTGGSFTGDASFTFTQGTGDLAVTTVNSVALTVAGSAANYLNEEGNYVAPPFEPADGTILKDADIGVTVQAYDATYLVDADIGVNVQAYDSTILVDADIGVTVQAAGSYEPADGTILKDADIGVTVQAFDATYLVDADIGVNVAAFNHNHDSVYLRLDGATTMAGAIKTSHGGIESTKVTSATEPAFELSSDKNIKTSNHQLLSLLDSGGAGLTIGSEVGSFSSDDLVITATGYTTTFDSLVFNIESTTGTIKFGSTAGGNKLGVNPGTNSITTDHATEIKFTANNGGVNVLTASTTSLNPQTTNVRDLGLTGTRWKNLWLSGGADITGHVKAGSLEAPTLQQTQTGTTYIPVLADADKMITMNNGASNTVTIPANSSVAYPVGTKLNFMQLGAGATTIAITTDTLSVNAALTKVVNGQYAVATAMKITSTSWVLFGNLVVA